MFNILITSDIHFETLERDKIPQYVQYFTDKIRLIQPDVFIIAGDTTDSQYLRMGSEDILYLNKFLVECALACKEHDIPFIILRGTPSHDGNNVANLINVGDGILENTVTEIRDISVNIIRGKKFLFLPETYLPTYNDFIQAVQNTSITPDNKADIIVFHGMFDFAISQLKQKDSSHGLNRSIIMSSDHLSKLTKTCAIGGHFHAYMVFDNIIYTDRFINTRGHVDSVSHLFGLKLLSIENDNSWRIINLENPYLIRQEVVDFDFINDNIDEIIERTNQMDNNSTIYRCKINSEYFTRNRFNHWLKETNPKYIKKIVVQSKSNTAVSEVATKFASSEISDESVKNLAYELIMKKLKEDDTNSSTKSIIESVGEEIFNE